MSDRQDPQEIRREIKLTVSSLVDKFRELEGRVIRRAAEVSDRFERASNTLKTVVETVTPSYHIKKSPLLSVGVATGAGVLAGKRRPRRRWLKETEVVVRGGGRTGLVTGLLSGGVVYLLSEAGKERFPRAATQIESIQNALLARIAQSLW